MLDSIIRYESGELEESEVIDLFQFLLDSGIAWQLQGAYGRQTLAYLNAGLISR